MRLRLLAAAWVLLAAASAGAEVKQRATGFRFPYYGKEGALAWILEAEEAAREGTAAEVEFSSPKVTVYKGEVGSERVSAVLTAASAKGSAEGGEPVPSGQKVLFSGSTKLLLFDGKGAESGMLNCESAEWDGKSRSVRGTGYMALNFEGNSLSGSGFTMDVESRRLRLEKDVEVRLKEVVLPDALEEEPLSIEISSSGAAEFALEERELELEEEVEARAGEGVLRADALSLAMGEERELVFLDAEEGVEFRSQRASGTADQLLWSAEGGEADSGVLRLVGRPRVGVSAANLPEVLGASEKLVLSAEDEIVFDPGQRLAKARGSPGISGGDFLVRGKWIDVFLAEPPGREVERIEAGGGVSFASAGLEGTADELRVYAAQGGVAQLLRNIKMIFAPPSEDKPGELTVRAKGIAKWDMEKGSLEVTRDVEFLFPSYRAVGNWAVARISSDTGLMEAATLYGTPVEIQGTDFSWRAAEVSIVEGGRRLIIKEGTDSVWYLKEGTDENQSGEEGSEGR